MRPLYDKQTSFLSPSDALKPLSRADLARLVDQGHEAGPRAVTQGQRVRLVDLAVDGIGELPVD